MIRKNRDDIFTVDCFNPWVNCSTEYLNSLLDNVKETNDMTDVLKRYKEKQINNLKKNQLENIERIKSEDCDYRALHELQNLISNYTITQQNCVEIDLDKYVFTNDKIRKDLNEEDVKYEKSKVELDEKIKDIEAVLDLATTYEQKRDILVSYGVLNADGTLAE